MPDENNNCDKKIFYYKSKQIGGKQVDSACGSPEKTLPQELKEPQGTLSVFKSTPNPRAVVLNSAAVTVTCEEEYPGSEGIFVSVAYGALTDTVALQSIAGINATVLQYVANASLEDELEKLLNSRTATVEAIRELTGMQQGTASVFLQLATAKLKTLDTNAKALAVSQLDCLYWNAAQTATCPDEDMASFNDHPDAAFEIIVPEHSVSSPVGKLSANTLAKAQATALLNCFYVSDAVSVDCVTRPDAPQENMEWVPTDPEDVYPRRVGSVTIPYGAYKSTVSKEAATNAARAAAYAMLNCFYKSEAIEVECDSAEARNPNIDPDLYDPIAITIETATKAPAGTGQKVTIPAGYITSELSTSDATQQANIIASYYLSCCFINDTITVECPADADKENSPTWSYSVARGTFSSCVSKEDANAQALAAVSGIVQCVYCNDIVLPKCVPDWVTAAVTSGIYLTSDFEVQGKIWPAGSLYKLDLPLNVVGLINPYTREPVDLSSWSEDATLGVPKSSICSNSKKEVQDIADLLPNTIIKANPSCVYKSTKLLAGCSFDDPFESDNADTVTSTDAEEISVNEAASLYEQYAGSNYSSDDFKLYEPESIIYYGSNKGESYRIYKKTPTTAISAELSTPAPGAYIEFPEGYLTASIEDVPGVVDAASLSSDEQQQIVKEYLDSLILTMAESIVYCLYGNPVTFVACGWSPAFPSVAEFPYNDNDVPKNTTIFGDPGAPAWWFGEGKGSPYYYPESNLLGPAPTSDPVIISRNSFTGKTYNSVLEQVKTAAASVLNCVYGNNAVGCTSNCDSASIPRNTVQADTAPEATVLAQAMATCAECPDVPVYPAFSLSDECDCECSAVFPGGVFMDADTDMTCADYCNKMCNMVAFPTFGGGADCECECSLVFPGGVLMSKDGSSMTCEDYCNKVCSVLSSIGGEGDICESSSIDLADISFRKINSLACEYDSGVYGANIREFIKAYIAGDRYGLEAKTCTQASNMTCEEYQIYHHYKFCICYLEPVGEEVGPFLMANQRYPGGSSGLTGYLLGPTSIPSPKLLGLDLPQDESSNPVFVVHSVTTNSSAGSAGGDGDDVQLNNIVICSSEQQNPEIPMQ